MSMGFGKAKPTKLRSDSGAIVTSTKTDSIVNCGRPDGCRIGEKFAPQPGGQ